MTTRDLTKVASEALRAEYEPKAAKLRDLRAQAKALNEEIAPLRDELAGREHKRTLMLNAVMGGHQALLRASGVPEETISELEAEFAAMRAKRIADREAAKAAEGAVSQ